MKLKVGALFAGYGGLELGLARVLDVEPAWFSEYEAAPSAILAHHWPAVPNHGDITKIRWADVEPVDIITGGSPCQDLSHAGKRAGMKAGTRSGLWASMCDAIETIRPSLVVWENVRGALSAEADSAVEPCPVCMGGPGSGVTLRALGRVLGDLAELGYDAAWTGLRAADVGAPHGRFRIFVTAWPATDTDDGQPNFRTGTNGTGDVWSDQGRAVLRARGRGGETPADTGSCGRDGWADLPGEGRHQTLRGQTGDHARHSDPPLLPTPAVNDMGAAYTPDTWDAWTQRMRAAHGNGNGHGASLHIEALRMLPTPTAMDSKASGGKVGSPDVTLTDATTRAAQRGINFGDYAPAIARWERLTRPAPPPTEVSDAWIKARARRLAGRDPRPVGMRGSVRRLMHPEHRLSPRFVEWMMGLPAGWVDVPGVGRNAQLKALGNGVVPQQAAAAVEHLLDVRAGVTGEAAA